MRRIYWSCDEGLGVTIDERLVYSTGTVAATWEREIAAGALTRDPAVTDPATGAIYEGAFRDATGEELALLVLERLPGSFVVGVEELDENGVPVPTEPATT